MSSKSASRLSVLCLSGALACAALTGDAEEVVLPLGDARPAIISRHFPDRMHEFVWRNWGAVEPDKLAAILRTSREDVTAIAASMGLPADISIAPEMRQRGYVTLIRRNWHLLPYEQLLELLEITPQQLDIMLREEDFLWVKLGRAKPSCEVLRYQPPDDASQQRAAEIRRVVKEEFGDTVGQLGEPRFDFVRKLGEPLADPLPTGART